MAPVNVTKGYFTIGNGRPLCQSLQKFRHVGLSFLPPLNEIPLESHRSHTQLFYGPFYVYIDKLSPLMSGSMFITCYVW